MRPCCRCPTATCSTTRSTSSRSRSAAAGHLDAIVRGGTAQVIFSSLDLLGALATDPSGLPSLAISPGGEEQREQARRLAVNLAMYVLCSNYKDDQVHAPFLMRRRGRIP